MKLFVYKFCLLSYYRDQTLPSINL